MKLVVSTIIDRADHHLHQGGADPTPTPSSRWAHTRGRGPILTQECPGLSSPVMVKWPEPSLAEVSSLLSHNLRLLRLPQETGKRRRPLSGFQVRAGIQIYNLTFNVIIFLQWRYVICQILASKLVVLNCKIYMKFYPLQLHTMYNVYAWC